MDTYKISLAAGDGVGTELTEQARKCLRALEKRYCVRFDISDVICCGSAIDKYGSPLPPSQAEIASNCQAVIIGNIGDRKYSALPHNLQPTHALLELRKIFNVGINLRPMCTYSEFSTLSPLKESIISAGMNILVVRDLMGGMLNFPCKSGRGAEGEEAGDLEYYNEQMIESIARFAFSSARNRRKCVHNIDKANVLTSSRLWREIVCRVSEDFPDIVLNHDYVDHASMELLSSPDEYDVILTSNVFGDILADEIAQITGTPWMFGSAELSCTNCGIYTPNQLHHPRSDKLRGQDAVCPYGIINATAMMLKYTLDRDDLSSAVTAAVRRAVSEKYITAEIESDNMQVVSTNTLGNIISDYILA